jgi:hypothetical protein
LGSSSASDAVPPDLRRYDPSRRWASNRVSFCFEIFDPKTFEESARPNARPPRLRGKVCDGAAAAGDDRKLN